MTLVEVLVTLAIVAVLTTVVVLGLGVTNRGADPQTEAHLLAERLDAAVDDVLVTRRATALTWDDGGYSFVTRDVAGRWSADRASAGGGRHDLPRGLTLSSDAPALLPIAGDGAASRFTMSIANARQAWSIDFDGITASTRAGSA